VELAVFNEKLDARDLPLYSQREVAHFIGVPVSTIRSWLVGATSGSGSPKLIRPSEDAEGRLSFNNLIEAYVLNSLRKKHDVRMSAIRTAITYAERELQVERLLLRRELRWSGDLFWDNLSELVNLSRSGQLAMRSVVESYLQRIDWDEQSGLPVRLFPFIEAHVGARTIVIDPRIAFGQPTLEGRGVPTSVIVTRIDAGEDIADLAWDYDVPPEAIEHALIYEAVV
jgi:uncharacterized protein (DUF433 family)